MLELEDGGSPRWYVGDYRYYLEKKASSQADGDIGAYVQPDAGEAAPRGTAPRGSTDQRDAGYEADKARKARSRKLKKREEEILARMEAIGAQKAAAEREMGLSANYSDGGRMKRLAAGIEELEHEATALNAEWELVEAELGSGNY